MRLLFKIPQFFRMSLCGSTLGFVLTEITGIVKHVNLKSTYFEEIAYLKNF